MQATRRTAVIVGVTCAALILPAAAQAKTKVVSMGLPAKAGKPFQKQGADVNDFFPHGTTIRAGDSVRFKVAEFHSVDLPAKGGDPLPLVAPAGPTVSGSNDAAGAPFWFNGQPQLGFNPALLADNFGKRLTYTGAKRVGSGLPLGSAKPMVVKFEKPGRYTYFCNIHPGMKGTVTVRAAGKRIPTARQDTKALRRQLSRDLKIAKRLTRTRPPASTVDVGSAGPHGVEVFAMFPQTLTANVGQTVRFRMTPASFEDHTATFGPGNPAQPNTYLGQLANSIASSPVFDPRAAYPSEKPGDPPASYSSTLHGNGFWNTGVMDRASSTPLASSGSVTFTAPGTYTFSCLIHPFMTGTIKVGEPWHFGGLSTLASPIPGRIGSPRRWRRPPDGVRHREERMRHRKLIIAGAVFGLAMGSGGAALAAGSSKAPAKATVKVTMAEKYKINRYVQTVMRWNKDVYHVRSGGTLRVTVPGGGEPHTFTVVRKRDLPRTAKQIDNCLPKGICGKLAMAHGADPSSNGPPKFLFLEDGKGQNTPPNIDRPGDSVGLGFGPKDQSFNLKVTAKKGTTLHFMCLIHPWMQAKVIVG